MNKKVKLLLITIFLVSVTSSFFFGRINYNIEEDIGENVAECMSWVLLHNNETVDVINETFTSKPNLYQPMTFSNLNPNKTYLLTYNYVPTPYENGLLSMNWVFSNETEYWLGFHLNKACITLSILENDTSIISIYVLFAYQIEWEIIVSEVFYDIEFGVYITGFISSLIISILYRPIKNYITLKLKKSEK